MILNRRMIAICGGIASGKSAVCQIIKSLGGTVISCDAVNRELLADPCYIELIANNFDGVVERGVVNKAVLREMIITDSSAKARLDALAHPRIKERIFAKATDSSGNVFVEVPLLKESGLAKDFHEIWFVLAPHDRRINQLTSRDNIPRSKAELIIALQSAEDELETTATRIIVNDGTYNQLCTRVEEAYYSIQ